MQKKIFYHWLLLNTSSNNTILEKLYSSNTSVNEQSTFFYKNLFKVTSALTLTNHYPQVLNNYNSNTTYNVFTKLPSTYWNLYLTYLTSSNSTSTTTSTENSLWALNTAQVWTPLNLNTTTSLYSNSKTPRGVFYTIASSFNELNSWSSQNELKWLLNYTQNQTMFVKFSRWLYKYNLLHRKAFVTSHKNTLTKRLLGSGFYDSQFDTRNVHSVSLKLLNPNYQDWVSSTYTNLYSSSTQPLNINNLQKYSTPNLWTKQTLASLNFQEDSYFWLLKRFYNFNNLSTAKQESSFFVATKIIPEVNSTFSTVSPTTLQMKNLLQRNLLTTKSIFTDASSTRTTNEVNSLSGKSTNILLVNNWNSLYSADLTELLPLLLIYDTSYTNTYNYYSYLLTNTPLYVNNQIVPLK